MKKSKLFIVLALAIFFQGCAVTQSGCKTVSSNTAGLDRTLTVYNNDGEVIKSWSERMRVGGKSGPHYVDLLESNKRVFIGGTFIIEEN